MIKEKNQGNQDKTVDQRNTIYNNEKTKKLHTQTQHNIEHDTIKIARTWKHRYMRSRLHMSRFQAPTLAIVFHQFCILGYQVFHTSETVVYLAIS